jgi:hypothetical protein
MYYIADCCQKRNVNIEARQSGAIGAGKPFFFRTAIGSIADARSGSCERRTPRRRQPSLTMKD